MSSSARAAIALLSIMVVVFQVAESVNYTCQALAFVDDAPTARCLSGCIGTAPTSKTIKQCKKPCKPASKFTKKKVKIYTRCLSLYWKGVEQILKKLVNVTAEAAYSRSVIRCLATTSNMASCPLTKFSISDFKVAKKAAKLDSKWKGKKCTNVLTPSTSTCPNPTVSTTASTTHGPTQAATTNGMTTAGATTSTATPKTST